jgi:hypothetical protein
VKQQIDAAVEEEAADLRAQVANTLEHFAEQLQQQNRHLQDFTTTMQAQMKESSSFLAQRKAETEETALGRQTELEARVNGRMKNLSNTPTSLAPATQPVAQEEPPASAQNTTADPAALEELLEPPTPVVASFITQVNPQSMRWALLPWCT